MNNISRKGKGTDHFFCILGEVLNILRIFRELGIALPLLFQRRDHHEIDKKGLEKTGYIQICCIFSKDYVGHW